MVDEFPSVMTLEEVSQVLRIDEQTVRCMTRQGQLRGFKVGRQWRFRSDDVGALLGVERPPIYQAR